MPCKHGMEPDFCAFCQRFANPTPSKKVARVNEIKSKAPHFKKDEDYFISLGLLAANCFVDAHVPPSLRANFITDYHTLTGLSTQEGDVGFTTADPNQWGISMRMYFSPRIPQIFPAFASLFQVTETNGGMLAINNKAWAYELFECGFRIGREHNLATIRSSIPEQFQDAFDVGISIASQEAELSAA